MNAITTYHAAPQYDLGDTFKIARAIAEGGLFGSTDHNAVMTLCLLAQSEGKHPAQIMQNYHIIKGKPAKKADAMLMDFLASGGKVEWHALSDEKADATFSHPQGGSVRIDWDKDRVKRADLGGNAMHSKYPRQMLRARVISEGVRTVFPGATGGMYVPEEVDDFDEPRPIKLASSPPRRSIAPTPFDNPEPISEAREEARAAVPPVPSPAQSESAGPGDGFDLGEPDHMAAATALDMRYRAARDIHELQQLWTATVAERQTVIKADGNYKAIFATILEREKARIEGVTA